MEDDHRHTKPVGPDDDDNFEGVSDESHQWALRRHLPANAELLGGGGRGNVKRKRDGADSGRQEARE